MSNVSKAEAAWAAHFYPLLVKSSWGIHRESISGDPHRICKKKVFFNPGDLVRVVATESFNGLIFEYLGYIRLKDREITAVLKLVGDAPKDGPFARRLRNLYNHTFTAFDFLAKVSPLEALAAQGEVQ